VDALVRDADAPPRKKPKDWLPDAAWRAACALAARGGALAPLPDALARAETAWCAWHDAPAPEALPLPDLEAKAPLPPFARAAAVVALRRDRALPALTAFAAAELGPAFADPPPSSVEGALADAAPDRPVLCLLSRGKKRERGGWEVAAPRATTPTTLSLSPQAPTPPPRSTTWPAAARRACWRCPSARARSPARGARSRPRPSPAAGPCSRTRTWAWILCPR
jgi:hypothetical protein